MNPVEAPIANEAPVVDGEIIQVLVQNQVPEIDNIGKLRLGTSAFWGSDIVGWTSPSFQSANVAIHR